MPTESPELPRLSEQEGNVGDQPEFKTLAETDSEFDAETHDEPESNPEMDTPLRISQHPIHEFFIS